MCGYRTGKKPKVLFMSQMTGRIIGCQFESEEELICVKCKHRMVVRCPECQSAMDKDGQYYKCPICNTWIDQEIAETFKRI